MNRILQFHVAPEEVGQRLDVFLASRLGDLSRMRIANLLAAGNCLVDQLPRPAGYHLAAGERVEITLDDSLPTTAMTPEAIPLAVVYEDEQIIVVNKASGMLVHPNSKTKSGTLANALVYHLNRNLDQQPALEKSPVIRPGLVHRLDRLTSGLMVVAKTQRALSILTRHFHQRLVKKLYTALVWGVVPEATGVIDASIGINPSKSPPRWVFADGKPAETRFRVTERLSRATLLELEPVTGRTNQLRIHCAYLGHPIVGDDLYGQQVRSPESGVWSLTGRHSAPEDEPPNVEASSPDSGLRTPDSERLCLHASHLEFHHPNGGQWMEFQAQLPEDMQKVLHRLRTA